MDEDSTNLHDNKRKRDVVDDLQQPLALPPPPGTTAQGPPSLHDIGSLLDAKIGPMQTNIASVNMKLGEVDGKLMRIEETQNRHSLAIIDLQKHTGLQEATLHA